MDFVMKTAEEVLKLLEEHVNVLLYGPPGTGKSHLMKEVENLFRKKYGGSSRGTRYAVDTTEERESITAMPAGAAHSRWVTFHQGYSYEDFVIGLRPGLAGAGASGSVLSLEAQPGAFLELAALSRDGHGLMLIDEINRGNASRIFGEFITLLEPAKRLASDGSPKDSTVTVTLPYLSGEQKVDVAPGVEIRRDFQMPSNVYTLASMNSVDKSVAPIDAAIRRRFYVVHLRPTDDDVYAAAGAKGSTHSVGELAAKVVTKVNRGVGIFLGPDYMLGQFYLPGKPSLGEMNEVEAKAALVSLWRHKVLPQLVEYFHARPAVCKNLLEFEKFGSDSGLGVVAPTSSEEDEGAMEFILNAEQEQDDGGIYSFLERFAGVAPATPTSAASAASASSSSAVPGSPASS